jgi:hypothetical protein
MALTSAIRLTPKAIVKVTTATKPSGIMAIATEMA